MWLLICILEYDLDSDDLDDVAIQQLQTEQDQPRRPRRTRDQSMPLLVGLLDTAHARRSSDGSLQLDRLGDEPPDMDVDLEELAAKRTAGGGMLDSIANMANSILGAGMFRCSFFLQILTVHSCEGIIGRTLLIWCVILR